MATPEMDIQIELQDKQNSAAYLGAELLPIGLVQDNPADSPDLDVLQADAYQLASTFRDTMATLLDRPPHEITNDLVELSGEAPLKGHPEGYPTKKESIQIGVMSLYKPNTDEPDGMYYTLRRTTSVNGNSAEEVATVILSESEGPHVSLERTSTHNGKIDAQDTFYQNSNLTLVGVQEMITDVQQAVEKGDAGLEVVKISPVRRTVVESRPKVSRAAEAAGNSVALKDAAIRLTASLATSVFERLPRGRVDLEGNDGTSYEIQTITTNSPATAEEIRMRKRTPGGNHQWVGMSVPYRGNNRPASVGFSIQGAPTREAVELRVPYPRSGLVVDFLPNSPEAIQGGLNLAREIHAGVNTGKIKKVAA